MSVKLLLRDAALVTSEEGCKVNLRKSSVFATGNVVVRGGRGAGVVLTWC